MYIDITDPQTIFATADPAGVNNREYFQKANITNMTPIFYDYNAIPQPSDRDTYPYPTMTKVVIEFNDGRKLDFECQSVVNQPTWNGGTQADLNQAIDDIAASL